MYDGSAMVFSNASDVKTGVSLALSNVKVHVVTEGYKFNFKERCMVIPKNPKAIAKKAATAAAGNRKENGNGSKARSNGNKK